MYSKFELVISDFFYNNELNKYLKSGKEIYKQQEKETKKSLKEFIFDNGHIDGTSMKNNWFHMENVDIFISHSHKDINKVQAFAGWLYKEFNLTAFIDSCVWGYCDQLLKQIDDIYCKNKTDKNYNYILRNYTTSHVHIMLATALAEMIDKTECIMFYNTPNSIALREELNKIKQEKKKITLSPWIYYELAIAFSTRKSRTKRRMVLENMIKHKAYGEQNAVDIEYNVDKYLNEMIKINENELESWKREYWILTHKVDGDNIQWIKGQENSHPLDVLYQLLLKLREKKMDN